MKTLDELSKEARKKHGDEVNIQKIYNNLMRDVYSGLNMIFRYGESGRSGEFDKFGHIGNVINAISSNEINLVILFIIECFVENRDILLRIQKGKGYDGFSNNKSLKNYLKIYNDNYLKILEKLHSLRNEFRNIKASNPKNYPDWIDEWESCFCVEVRFRHRQNINTKDKEEIIRKINLSKYVSLIISCLFLRCRDVMEKYKAQAETKRDQRVFH